MCKEQLLCTKLTWREEAKMLAAYVLPQSILSAAVLCMASGLFVSKVHPNQGGESFRSHSPASTGKWI